MTDFIDAALPWVTIAVALAIIFTYSDLARKHSKEKDSEK